MYFENIDIIDIDEIINSNYKIYAHKCDERNELLKSHVDLCLKYFKYITSSKSLDNVFNNIEKSLFLGESSEFSFLFRDMLVNTISLHDIGKVNAYFQKKKLNNNLHIKNIERCKYSDHSLLSAIVYIDIFYKRIDNLHDISDENKKLLYNVLFLNSYAISRHHGDLKFFEEFIEKFNTDSDFNDGYNLLTSNKILHSETLCNQIDINEEIINEIFYEVIDLKTNMSNKDFNICCFIYERLILSILYACDYYATTEFMNGVELRDIGIISDINEFYDIYKKSTVYQSIRKYEQNFYMTKTDFSDVKDINILRNELFLDAEKNLINNIDSNIFYLEAPTGSGKSNVATNLSFKLLEKDLTKNKIIYVYPFNTLVEQNIENFRKIFCKEKNIFNKISVINSTVPVKMDLSSISNEEEVGLEYYKRALLNRQFLNYPMILTTHVSLFNFMFGENKENIFPMYQLANSIIVLDEIQSYKNTIWGEIITFLTMYSKLLNIKFIIMSATLPDLDLLSLCPGTTVKLINDREKYFSNPMFRNRVSVDYSFLNSTNVFDDLYNHVIEKSYEKKNILIEFITKKTAYEFYNKLIDDENVLCEVELMTGDDNIAERERILNKITNNTNDNGIILVATQVVEAGVDIDMDIGYKDISLFDSEEQFLGRINRSCKKQNCVVFFFNLDSANTIYRGDIRINEDITLKEEYIREILKNKNCYDYYNIVIERLKSYTNKLNSNNIESFYREQVRELDFAEISNHMKLIKDDNNKLSIYLSSELTLNGEILNGDEIWEKYKEILNDIDMDYSEKRVKLSQVRGKMNNFIYEIRWYEDFTYNDRIGDLYYIENGEKYFTNGKLDKEKFKKGIGDFI